MAGEAAPAPGHQRLHIETWGMTGSDFPLARIGFEIKPDKMAGAKCTARNEKGSWQTTTPGTVDVATGAGPLTIECDLDGFRTARGELPCITPRWRSTSLGAAIGFNVIALVGPVVLVSALGPAALGAVVGSVALGAAAGNALAGPDADVCNYPEGISVQMTR